ncbi:MAG TPA: sialidase family protein [Terriglobia bacterium]|nr:sialidase family protein [Terriglobia bacterium]
MTLHERQQESFSRHPRRRVVLGFICFLGMLSNLTSIVPGQNLPTPPGARVMDITPKPGWFTEPSIAINPHNPQQVAVAYQDNAHIAYSFDAGQHWDIAAGTEPSNYRVSGDVSVTYDKQGHAILCYMAFDKLGTFNYWAHNASRSGLFVRRSQDGGKTWESQHIPIIEHETKPGMPFEDKPYIVADNSRGPHAGNLYVGWTRWTIEDSQILLSRSTDDGKTWSAPIEIDEKRGLPRDDNGAAEGFSGVVGPDGTLYAVWALGDHIVFTSSRDGGLNFSTPQNIIPVAPIMFHVDDVARANGFPVLAMDPRKGKLYVTWSDYRNGEVDVFCSTSIDRGRTWTREARVNSDAVHNGADHFFHWLAVDPTSGDADVIFYDRRDDPGNRKAKVVLARSTDGGKTFTNYAWTQEAFEPGGIFMGDYTGIAALGGRVYGVWPEKPATQERSRDTIIRVGVADFGVGNSKGTNKAGN